MVNGPVRARLQVTPDSVPLSELVDLVLEVDHEPGVEIVMPPLGDEFGEFVVRDFQQPLPAAQGGREVLVHRYRLEPKQTGRWQIPPLAIRFTDQRRGEGNARQTLSTESLTVTVSSILSDKVPTLDDLQPMSAPVELSPPLDWLWWTAIGIVVFAAVVTAAMFLPRRPTNLRQKVESPYALALLEFEQLVDDGSQQHDVKHFYAELTGIVRRFIERTKGIRAIEQTTDEFLRETEKNRAFNYAQRKRLADFLSAADLVKFGGHQPAAADVKAMLQTARLFLEDSREQEPTVAEAEAKA